MTFQTTLDTGFANIDDDFYMSLLIRQQLTYRGLHLAIDGPFRFRIIDRSPDDEKGLRKQDWDEPSDWARILPRISYEMRLETGKIGLLAGELNNISMGLGTTLSHFFNAMDVDHYKGGLKAIFDINGNGGTFLINNVIHPEILAGRIQLSPFSWFKTDHTAHLLEIAYSVTGDIRAPYSFYEEGTKGIVATGGDLILSFFQNRLVRARVYASLMVMDGDIGNHLGLDTQWQLSERRDLYLYLQGEYRYAGSDYHPAVFNPFYEKNRYDFMSTSSDRPLTLADHLTYEPDMPPGHGFMFEGDLVWRSILSVEMRYDREGKDRPHWIFFSLGVTPIKGYHLKLFYAADDPTGGNEIFSYNALMALAFRARIWGPIDCFGHYSRRFRRDGGGVFYVNDIIAGIGVSVTY